MAYSRIGGATAGSSDGNSVTTGGIDTTGADLLILVVGQDATVADAAISDSKGNTWNALTEQVESPARCAIYWSRPTSVGSGHTFTAAQTDARPVIAVEAWAGSASSPFDQENGAGNAVGTTLATGSVTPTENNELIVAGIAIRGGSGSVSSINSSFTLRGNTAPSGGVSEGAAIATLVQTTAGAVNPTWTVANADSVKAARIATFKAAPAPSGGGNFFLVF